MKILLTLLLTALCATASAQQTDTSTNIESAHLFRNSRGKNLQSLLVFNSWTNTVYIHLHNSYTAVTPGTNAVNNASYDSGSTNIQVLSTPRGGIGSKVKWAWDTGEPPEFSVAGAGITLTTNTTFWIRTNSTNIQLFLSLDNAISGINPVFVDCSVGPGCTSTNGYFKFLTSVGFPPIAIPTNSTASLTYPLGRPFNDGIYCILSTTPTNYTAPAQAAGLFDAVYSQ